MLTRHYKTSTKIKVFIWVSSCPYDLVLHQSRLNKTLNIYTVYGPYNSSHSRNSCTVLTVNCVSYVWADGAPYSHSYPVLLNYFYVHTSVVHGQAYVFLALPQTYIQYRCIYVYGRQTYLAQRYPRCIAHSSVTNQQQTPVEQDALQQ